MLESTDIQGKLVKANIYLPNLYFTVTFFEKHEALYKISRLLTQEEVINVLIELSCNLYLWNNARIENFHSIIKMHFLTLFSLYMFLLPLFTDVVS